MTLGALRRELRCLADPKVAAGSRRYFKTGPGEYGEGDRFIGVRVPALRTLVRRNPELALEDALVLLASRVHEERLLALLFMVARYKRAGNGERGRIYRIYLEHTPCINNWDLVDSSAHHILGAHLLERSRRPLYKLAASAVLWERRIAIIATFAFIAGDDFDDALALAECLLEDDEDLIHKAVGWALREIGKRDRKAEEDFLRTHYRSMPRTMLRYAIENFPEGLRRRYLKGRI